MPLEVRIYDAERKLVDVLKRNSNWLTSPTPTLALPLPLLLFRRGKERWKR